MESSFNDQLQEAVNALVNSTDKEEKIKHLANAFNLFSKETKSLKIAYESLKQRFDVVSNELEKKNDEYRKKAVELNTVSNYLNNILKNISQGILFINKEGIITTCNRAAKKILNLNDDILLQNFWGYFKDDFFGFSMKNALHFGLSMSFNYISLSFEDGQKDIEISSSYVHEEPSYQGVILLLRDVTDLQRLQLLASRNERMKKLGEMAASMAHEIRNPLGGIRGYASLLLRDLSDHPHLKQMVQYIIDGTKSLERLVNNVLHFTRPLKLQPTSLDISSIIKEICKFIKHDPAFPPSVIIEMHLFSFIVPIDKELFKSAILNILVNAFQAIDKEGKITISLIKNNNNCVIDISDTGKGVDEKDLENIFSPFFTTKDKGNGLGLSETYKIIQAHGGTIDVRSCTNVGTTFTLILPLNR